MSREVRRQGSRFPEALQDEKSHSKTIYLWGNERDRPLVKQKSGRALGNPWEASQRPGL